MLLYDEAIIGVPLHGLILIVIFWAFVGGAFWPDNLTTEPAATVFIVAAAYITLLVIRTFSWQALAIPCGLICAAFLISVLFGENS